jgi:magnesium transporter
MQQIDQQKLDEPVIRHARHDYTTLQADQTIAQALESLRGGKLGERIVYFYVVDQGNRLLGVMPTRRLLMSSPDVRVRDLMNTNVISIPESMTTLEACELFVMHRLLAFPIVSEENKLLGVVDVNLFTEEMFEVSERQSAQDIFQLIGVHIARGRHVSPLVGFADRFPWLLCNIAGGIGCAFIAGLYENFMNAVIVLALFIPVVLALAESVSMQSMTITLQGFHEAGFDWRSIARSLRREFLVAALLGAASGFVVAAIAFIWKREPMIALAIWISIALSMITACLLGVLLPTLVRLFRGDPRIAAGPVVLATADIATLLFYFNLAGVLLR